MRSLLTIMSITVISPRPGVRGAKSDRREIAVAFQDARSDIDEMNAVDDRVVVRWALYATQTGPLAGLSATQKKIAVRGISPYRLRDGKITETRNLADLPRHVHVARRYRKAESTA